MISYTKYQHQVNLLLTGIERYKNGPKNEQFWVKHLKFLTIKRTFR